MDVDRVKMVRGEWERMMGVDRVGMVRARDG